MIYADGRKRVEMAVLQVIQRRNDTEVPIEAKEGLDQVLFIPEVPPAFGPFGRVISRTENVMEMHVYPGAKSRKDLEHLKQDITTRPNHVRRVYEQEVTRAQHVEGVEAGLFDALPQNTNI
jgi:hypothetical protein